MKTKQIVIKKPVGVNGREWVDSHNYIKNLKTLLSKIQEDKELSQKNKEILFDFIDSNPRLSPATSLKNLQVGYSFLKDIGKDMNKITVEDCKKYYKSLLNSNKKPWTLRKYISVIKRFFRWHYSLSKDETVPQLKTWTATISIRKWIDPDTMPTQLQVKQAIESLNLKGTMMEARSQFLLSLLNDLGSRCGEVLAMNLSDVTEVTVEHQGKTFQVLRIKIVQSKTNPRIILSYLSKPYFKKYLALRGITKENINEFKDTPLFINNTGQRLHYHSARQALTTAFDRINFKFPTSHALHFLRHVFRSRAENSDVWGQAKLNYWLAHGGGSIVSGSIHFLIEMVAVQVLSCGTVPSIMSLAFFISKCFLICIPNIMPARGTLTGLNIFAA